MSKIFLLILLCNISILQVFADNKIYIRRGHSDPIPIAINDFQGGETSVIGTKIIDIISNNLHNSGIFKPTSRAAFIDKKLGVSHIPLFAAWQQINTHLLLNGSVRNISNDKFEVQCILWDTVLEDKVASESFILRGDELRSVAHKISDLIYFKATGYIGYFNTKIVYVSETGSYLKRVKRLAIMDQDGHNHQYLTDGSDLVLTPRFAPDGKSIMYLSYKQGFAQIYVLNLRNKKSRLLGKFSGMSFAPRFSPDGKSAIMSIAKNGATNIYEMNLRNKKLKQLTHGYAINTSPSYSPDGTQIAFNSLQNYTRKIFIMNRDGSQKRPISFGGGSYSEPNWSSRNLIAFTKMTRENGFTIGIMRPESSKPMNNERLIAKGYLVESPAWAQNGRVLAFTKSSPPRARKTQGLSRIYTIDFTGYNERIIPTPHDASDADWSNLIK